MHRVAWLALLAACRIGFDELAPDGNAGASDPTMAPSGQPFTSTCEPGLPCIVDCRLASACTVFCDDATSCEVTCPPEGCTVTGCRVELPCKVECATGEPPTRYTSFATCP